MYNIQNAQKTVMELRNAMSMLRSAAAPADVSFEALEAVLGRGLVDLSLAVEVITQLATENEELRNPKPEDQENQDVPRPQDQEAPPEE